MPKFIIHDLPAILMWLPGSRIPAFGLTQYLLGAVVLILKHTLFSDGFESFNREVVGVENGPTNITYGNGMF